MVNKKESMAKDARSFTGMLDDLENIVTLLESGDVELENALDIYEKGRALATECQKRLKAAEGRLRMIDEAGQEIELAPEIASISGSADE